MGQKLDFKKNQKAGLEVQALDAKAFLNKQILTQKNQIANLNEN